METLQAVGLRPNGASAEIGSPPRQRMKWRAKGRSWAVARQSASVPRPEIAAAGGQSDANRPHDRDGRAYRRFDPVSPDYRADMGNSLLARYNAALWPHSWSQPAEGIAGLYAATATGLRQSAIRIVSIKAGVKVGGSVQSLGTGSTPDRPGERGDFPGCRHGTRQKRL